MNVIKGYPMSFYFTVYVIIGILARTAWEAQADRANPTGQFPVVAYGAAGHWIILMNSAAILLAVLTSLFTWGFWVVATIIELVLGSFIGSFLPTSVKAFIFPLSPVILIILFGALWNFWYL